MAENTEKRVDIAAARAKLASGEGREYWKGLEELAETPDFNKFIEDEFPERQSLFNIDRRNLLKFMGASLLLGGLGGCRSLFMPQEKIVPYVKAPEDQVLGRPMFFASTFEMSGYGVGIVVEQHEGRPTKIEGNVFHPSCWGKSDAFTQAALLSLYDPDRAQVVQEGTEPASWDAFYALLREKIDAAKVAQGQGIAILMEPTSSPTTLRLISEVKQAHPQLTVTYYEPVNRDASYESTRKSFGSPMELNYDFTKADVVVTFDGDFMHEGPGHVRYASDFAVKRDPSIPGSSNRLYAFESTPTLVGAMADHRVVCRSSEMLNVVAELARKLGVAVNPTITAPKNIPAKVMNAMASDLISARGKSIVVAGDQQSADVHVIVHAINAALENFGQTIMAIPAVLPAEESCQQSMSALISRMNSGEVKTLLILGGNPAYSMPNSMGFREALAKVEFKVHHSLYFDETSEMCDWTLPATHFLEHWSDARGHDGTLSVVQPLIAPLYNGESVAEVLSTFIGPFTRSYDAVRETWKPALTGDFEKAWREVLHNGVLEGSAPTPVVPPFQQLALQAIMPGPNSQGIEVNIRPDSTIWDGRFANNGWLQELPKALSTLTWDNAALISPRTAEKLGLDRENIIEISTPSGLVQAPVLVLPGQMDDAITLHLGYGRSKAGRVGNDTGERNGCNAYAIMPRDGSWSIQGAGIKRVGGTWLLATCQEHHYMEGRDIVRAGTMAELAQNPNLQPDQKNPEKLEKSLYPDQIFDPTGYSQWAMTVDLALCTGCNACVAACQAENNIPVVGKREVRRGREMHWMRIDRYYRINSGGQDMEAERQIKPKGSAIFDPNGIETYFMPLMCQHCEKAPCEPVCPVAATVHSHEGLNQMVYNRCVGTRYCSNNCPYKVRRFNFLNYTDNQAQFQKYERQTTDDARQLLRMVNNPNVTVRGRGVMEKCTYCVQRINTKRIDAKREGRDLGPNEVVTACQQACPTNAIIFGDMSNPESLLAKSRQDPRSYKLLQETGSRPRTTYKVRVLNPNPEVGKA